MALFSCFSLSWKRKNNKGARKYSKPVRGDTTVKTLHVKLEHVKESSETTGLKSSFFTLPATFLLPRNSKVMNHESPVSADSRGIGYESGDEQDKSVVNSNSSDLDSPASVENSNEETKASLSLDVEKQLEMIESGHLSDPGTKADFWTSRKLKRSCSDLAMRSIFSEEQLLPPPLKSKFYEKIQKPSNVLFKDDDFVGDIASPVSVRSRCSADKVMLKKHSSCQILPSRSRRLWWKLFLWSHRNLHKVSTLKQLQPIELNQQEGGYSSDTIEPKQAMLKSYPEDESADKGNRGVDGLYGVSGMWPQNQWLAFNTDTLPPLSRVNEWVKEVSSQPPYQKDDNNQDEVNDGIIFPPSNTALERSSSRSKEVMHANTVIQSLNSSSTVAHISSTGLKVIPIISHFSSLRSVNLSGNYIVHITPGSLPKGLHTLNLSKNKISTIEGLRDLTRLRELDLSYNKITRIGQGLSNCAVIKELYLAGNKISVVEGLHRLLKLNVLDLSFNKITTTKALGQLVANYNSLIAVNLLGNPIQSNLSDDLLRKAVCSLLPKLALLNRQPINQQKAREIRADSIAKAALGNSNSWNSRRKGLKRLGSSSSGVRKTVLSLIRRVDKARKVVHVVYLN